MILFPNAKVNLGLDVLRKLPDGYHNIETLFYPLQLTDILEIIPSDDFSFVQTGIPIEGNTENNLVVKAYRLMQKKFQLQNVHIHLHKVIPFGAGLGGGSSDAAFMLKVLNQLFQLNLSNETLHQEAVQLGSDCPFFILNQPVFAEGRGERFSTFPFSLKGYFMLLITPNVVVSTQRAYDYVQPEIPAVSLKERLKMPLVEWKEKVENNFERSVFQSFPELGVLKQKLYDCGAIYASMSGSGSSLFGIFKQLPEQTNEIFKNCMVWTEECL